jgi:acyl-CoA synthetase (AMP-forming)/AMP-acid ligase II
VDRRKDMICRGGENVYPREIEEAIATHPGVLEVAVIAVPDDRLQEEIMAVVAAKAEIQLEERDIVRTCEAKLARFKKPRYVAFVDQIPKNASGKTLKRELREHYRKGPLPPKLK